MKNKSIYFSNFKFTPTNNNIKENSLSIDKMYNVTTSDGYIETLISPCEYLSTILSEEKYEKLCLYSSNIINKTKQFINYEFINEDTGAKMERIFAIAENKLYELNLDSLIFVLIYTFSQEPNILLYRNIYYLFDKNKKCLIIDTNKSIQIEYLPQISNLEISNNFLYFQLKYNPYTFYQTELLDLNYLSGNIERFSSYKIDVSEGEILSIVYLKNKIFIITQYAIFKLNEENNTITKQNIIESKILKNSIKKIDNKIIFYSTNGLYEFDGNDISLLFDNKLKIYKNAKSICFNQNYYIFTQEIENFVFKYNFSTNSFEPIKIDNIINLYVIKTSKQYLLISNCHEVDSYKNISLYNKNQNSQFNQYVSFKPLVFSSSSQKQLFTIQIKTEGSFILKITSELSSTSINVTSGNNQYTTSLNGSYFNFEINSSNNFKLDFIIITYQEEDS